MDNNNQINVQDIMKEIKKEIEVKGYTNDLLSFDDVIVDVGAMNVNKFDKVKFNEDVYFEKNYPINKEQAEARCNYNENLHILMEIAVDIKAAQVLTQIAEDSIYLLH